MEAHHARSSAFSRLVGHERPGAGQSDLPAWPREWKHERECFSKNAVIYDIYGGFTRNFEIFAGHLWVTYGSSMEGESVIYGVPAGRSRPDSSRVAQCPGR